jgi:alkanesulfonate monooxygenase SsuD/methylene tetrahydromethanopterin reductase-like flavin-dependent oxidoreductase (luciferase family)
MVSEYRSERTGALVVRVWIEGPGTVFKARLTRTNDVMMAGEIISYAGSPEQVYEQVRAWLEEFQANV